MDVGTLHYNLEIDDKNLQAQLSRAEGSVKSFGDKVSHHWDNAVAASNKFALGVAAIGAAAVGFGVISVKAFNESEQSLAQLDAVLKSTGGAAGVTRQDAIALSREIQNTTAVSDEAALAVENMALTFTAIHKDIFPQTTKAAIDMATALNHGMKPSAEQSADAMKLLGKALQDPDAGLGALHRVGVNVDELQKKFVGVTDVATKQKMILAELGTEFGGSATANAKTFAGQLAQLGNAFNDLEELVGQTIMNAAKPFIGWLNQLYVNAGGAEGIMKKLTSAFQKLQPFIPAIAGAIIGGLVPSVVALVVAMLPLDPVLLALMAAGALAGVAFKALVDHFGGLSNTIKAMQPLLRTMQQAWDSLVGIFNTYILPLLKMLADTFMNELLPALRQLWTQLSPILIPALKALAVILGGIILGSIMATIAIVIVLTKTIAIIADVVSYVVQFAVGAWNFFAAVFTAVGNAIMAVWNTVLKPVFNAVMFVLSTLYTIWSTIWGTILQITLVILQGIAQVVYNILGAMFGWVINTILRPLYNFFASIFQSIYNAVAGPMRAAYNAIAGPLNDALNWIRGAYNGFVGAGGNLVNGLVAGIRNGAGAVINTITSICQQALSAVKRFFGIRSPSTVFAGIGENLGLGMIKGIDGVAGQVQDAVTGMTMPGMDVAVTGGVATKGIASMGAPSIKADLSPGGSVAAPTQVSQTVTIGEVHIDSEQTADYFFKKLSRDQELAVKGLTTQAGSVG